MSTRRHFISALTAALGGSGDQDDGLGTHRLMLSAERAGVKGRLSPPGLQLRPSVAMSMTNR